MRAARPPAGRERGSAEGSGRRGGQGRRRALCRAWLSPATGARGRRRGLVPVGSRGRAALRDGGAEPARRCGASPGRLRVPGITEGLRGAPAPVRPAATALAGLRQAVAPALAREAGSALPALRLGAGSAPARCGQSAPTGPSWGLCGAAPAEGSGGARWLLCLSPLLPVITLPIERSELGQNKSGGITVGFVSSKSCLKLLSASPTTVIASFLVLSAALLSGSRD